MLESWIMKKLLGIVVLGLLWCNVGYSENLSNTSPENQYKFATVYLEVGDWNNAERAFKEFVEKNPNHELAGNAQYWYAETFRFRKLYTKAASAYLENHKKYPKNEKAPINIIKLGISLIQLGEKEQGCLLITGVKKLFPKTSEKIKLKANYEAKKFSCKGISVNVVVDTIPNISKDLATEALLKVKKVKIKKTSKNWQPSLRGECDPSKNISPVLEDLTVALASLPADALLEQKVTFEPSILFNDETFTLMVRNMDLVGNNSGVKIPLYVSDAARYYEVYQEDQKPQLYDDGTHGDVRANDGVYTRSCLSLPSADWSGKSFQTGHYILFLDSSFRNTETVTEIAEGVSINDTGFFISLGNEYTKNRKTKNYHSLTSTDTSKAMKAVWDAKGSIFDIISINPREQLVGGGGMYRVHDFIQGLGHKPPCPNYSYCYSFLDGLKHPELIAVIIISDLNPSPLTHEIEHAMLGINSGDDFPQGNTNPADDRKFLLTREWSVDGGHIEADSNVNTTLKGPLWDPARGYPHHVNLKVDGELLETHFGRDADGTFRLKERTDKDFQLSDIFLYMLGVIDANEATETYYKLVNYRLNDCVPGERSNLVCTNDLIDYDEVIPFTTQDFINKFGEYSNPRSSSFDPANIKLGILNISDRKHTDAEITYKSKIFRSYAKGVGPKIQFGDEVLRGHIWSHITKGKSNVIIDFTKN